MTHTHSDITIIGAGLAGLAAARELKQHGYNPLIVEARDRPGGRVCSVQLPDGRSVDLGAQWIGPAQKRLQAIAQDANLKLCRVKVHGKTITEPQTPLSIFDRFQIARLAWYFSRQAKKTPVDRPWFHPDATQLDQLSIAAWLDQHCTPRVATAWSNMIRRSFCTDADSISVLEALQHLATIGGFLKLASAETHWFEDGAAGVARYLAQEQNIKFNMPVKSIKQTADKIEIHSDQSLLTTNQLILAVPPPIATRLLGQKLSARYGAFTSTVTPHVVKTVLVYPTPWWRQNKRSGFASSALGPVNELMDCSPIDGDMGCLVAITSGAAACQLPADESTQQQVVIDHVNKLLDGGYTQPTTVHSLNWNNEHYSCGGYSAVRPVGSWLKQAQHAPADDGPVYLACTEIATEWRSYMEGALQSGENAARRIVAKQNT